MKFGEFRLHWDDCDLHLYQDFPCLNDALNHAAKIYGMSRGKLTRLENWMGEDACLPDQILPIAKIRSDAAREGNERAEQTTAMEATSTWGTF